MRIGQKVRWTSQSGGSYTEKSGEVIAEIPAGESAMAHVPNTVKRGHIKFGDISTKDRVLVAFPAGKYGQIIHYYCPLKSMIPGIGV